MKSALGCTLVLILAGCRGLEVPAGPADACEPVAALGRRRRSGRERFGRGLHRRGRCGCRAGIQFELQPKEGRVVTDRGTVEGVRVGASWAFKGIPYAAPPVDALRWKPPQPSACWNGVRPASGFGYICMQRDSNGTAVGSEDCLTANVWTPAASTQGLPVMVFIHGGSHVSGSSRGNRHLRVGRLAPGQRTLLTRDDAQRQLRRISASHRLCGRRRSRHQVGLRRGHRCRRLPAQSQRRRSDDHPGQLQGRDHRQRLQRSDRRRLGPARHAAGDRPPRRAPLPPPRPRGSTAASSPKSSRPDCCGPTARGTEWTSGSAFAT